MTDHDPAFLWETEAIRSAAHRVTEAAVDETAPEPQNGDWVTLRQASRSTGIPVETLRKWARRTTVPTYLAPASNGTNVRMVDLTAVIERAAALGRPVQAAPEPLEKVAVESAAPSPTPAASPQTVIPQADPVPPGTMIVPVDAWNKMLNQLGNLHEAGKDLGEARERAAKAETEAKFLRERLAELRKATPQVEVETQPRPAPPSEQNAEPPEKVWRYLMRRVRDRDQG